MAKDRKPYRTIKGLTLESAIERVVGPLKPLYAATAAYSHMERLCARKAEAPGELPPDFERLLEAKKAYVRTREAIVPPFIESLKTGELVADVRRYEDIGAILRRLRPDEASQLSIEVDVSGSSLLLRGPGKERLHARFSSSDAAPQLDAIPVKVVELPSGTQSQKTRKRKRKPHLVRPVSAVNDCTAYIAELLNKSPSRPTITLAKLRRECQKRFKLTWRGFAQARQDALAEVPQAKTAWTAPGRR
jgi:hypothetical protein